MSRSRLPARLARMLGPSGPGQIVWIASGAAGRGRSL